MEEEKQNFEGLAEAHISPSVCPSDLRSVTKVPIADKLRYLRTSPDPPFVCRKIIAQTALAATPHRGTSNLFYASISLIYFSFICHATITRTTEGQHDLRKFQSYNYLPYRSVKLFKLFSGGAIRKSLF